jgi:GntR family transcriptional regulator/MocR family aminotransferase
MVFHVSLVGRQNLSGEIYRQLRGAIVDGRLRPGDRLPPTRELASGLSVSRTTVSVAYDRLAGEGFVTSRVGAGTFVTDHAPQQQGRAKQRRRDALSPRKIWDTIPLPTAFGRRAHFDFRSGLPDATLFPHVTWRRLMGREMRSDAVGVGVYGSPAGLRPLRDAIARHIGTARAIDASADDIVITSGTQQALDVIARVLLSAGDRVAIEDPGYMPARALFRTLGMRLAAVPVDDEGLVVDALPRDIRLVYVTPSHQYPLGVPMSLPRRLALLAWAERCDAAIIEDDYDSEFRFAGRPIEPLQTLDRAGRVVYVGSFSKTMLPTLRLGFIIIPSSLRDAMHRAKFVSDWHTSQLAQATLARFIDEGLFAQHVRKMNTVYRARRELITETLTRDFAEYLELVRSAAGLHLAARARAASPERIADVASRAFDAGVAVQELAKFAVDARSAPGLVLGYGAIPIGRIEEGLRRLRACFRGDSG